MTHLEGEFKQTNKHPTLGTPSPFSKFLAKLNNNLQGAKLSAEWPI
jgi:hypothetical protein